MPRPHPMGMAFKTWAGVSCPGIGVAVEDRRSEGGTLGNRSWSCQKAEPCLEMEERVSRWDSHRVQCGCEGVGEDRVTVRRSNVTRGLHLCESSTQHIIGAHEKVGGCDMIMFCPV